MDLLKNVVVGYLKETIANLENNTCELNDEDINEILKILAHKPLSKELACDFMHLSRAAFDNRVSKGYIPKGRKRSGFKELVWFEDELEESKLKYKEM